MTAIASFLSISKAGKKTLSMISDSRITWTDPKNNVLHSYDYSQKIFRLQNSLDILGYCGDSFFCLLNLSQMVSYLNYSKKFTESKDANTKLNIIKELLENSLKTYPNEVLNQDFTIYWNTLFDNEFISYRFVYSHKVKLFNVVPNKIPDEMIWVFYDGSGGKYFYKALDNLNYRDNNYSRTYFKALVDIIQSEIDNKTGGSPQMISLRMTENDIQTTSVIYKGDYYIHGILDHHLSDEKNVEYRDLDFNYYTEDGTKRNNYSETFNRKQPLLEWKKSTLQNASS